MQLHTAQRELALKVVYYGPGLSGKTTNLQRLHARLRPDVRGEMLNLETRDDRTLFFDLLPVHFRVVGGYRVKLRLFTVPGQVLHSATRRVVLQGADAVAFVADSRRNATADNNLYWRNLEDNMRQNGLDPEWVPRVIQFNKNRDLPDSRTAEEIEQVRRKGKERIFEAVAVRGEGVVETFHGLMEEAFRALDARTQVMRTLGISEGEFLSEIFGNLDASGTNLEGRYAKVAGGAR